MGIAIAAPRDGSVVLQISAPREKESPEYNPLRMCLSTTVSFVTVGVPRGGSRQCDLPWTMRDIATAGLFRGFTKPISLSDV